MREFRHQNPYDISSLQYDLYNDQAEYNIPILIFLSNELYNILVNENRTTLLLLTRDGCLLKKIFRLIYPDIKCLDLQASRFIHRNPTEEYKEYLKSMYDHKTCLIFDLFGAFKSGRELYMEIFGAYPRVHLLGRLFINYKAENYKGLTYTGYINLEGFNVDTIGTLKTLKNGVFVRDEVTEYEIVDAMLYKDTVDAFVKFSKTFVFPMNSDLLEVLIYTITRKNALRCNVWN
jgi:predicted HAD superfamily hydrolase